MTEVLLAPARAVARPATGASGEIRLTDVSKSFSPGNYAVREINLTIPDGCYCCLLGPSGCGKTTILRMIAGHETPSAGEITIGGHSVVGLPPGRRGTAMMFQSYALFPHLSVLDNVAFYLKMRGVRKDERRRQARAMLERVQLDHLWNRMPAQLSGGQQQRVALARALITNPRVLLLDEPLSALDEFLRLRMRGELRSLQAELGITFVHVTHTQPEAIALADLVVVMETGEIEHAASAAEIFDRPASPYVARFMGGQNVLTGRVVLAAGARPRVESSEGWTCELPAAPPPAGTIVSVAIRRDRVTLSRRDRHGEALPSNAVAGRVEAIEYQGTYFKVTLNTGMKDAFVANVTDADFAAEPVGPGDAVLACWRAEHVHVLARPDSGDASVPYLDATE
ncbi:MAG: ABC transporter ATP-binding protein [Acetobacteraceae bacterium]